VAWLGRGRDKVYYMREVGKERKVGMEWIGRKDLSKNESGEE